MGLFELKANLPKCAYNAGHNKEILKKCKALSDYANYVADVKRFSKSMPIKDAVNKAVDIAISQNSLDGFFKKHKEGGVVDMSLTEYNEAEFIENRREEGRQEGREEGRREGIEEGIEKGIEKVVIKALRKNRTCEEIAEFNDIPLEAVKEVEKKLLQTV